MLFFDGGLALIAFAVWVFCIIDVITTPDSVCRNLPKMVWLLIVMLLPDVGSIAWLVAGHNWNTQSRDVAYKSNAYKSNRGGPAAAAGRPRATNPDDDEEFLAALRARADEQRRRARETDRRDEPPGATPPKN